MSEQAGTSDRSFRQWVRDTWNAGMAIHAIVEKGGRRIVDLPLNVVIIAGILAPWALGIGVVVAVIAGYRLYTERPPAAQAEAPEDTTPAPEAPAAEVPVDAVAEAGITPPPGTEAGDRAPEPPPGA
jgi:hypothetical protein